MVNFITQYMQIFSCTVSSCSKKKTKNSYYYLLMFKLLCVSLILSDYNNAFSQEVLAHVDQVNTTLGEGVTLTIDITGGSPSTPDISDTPDWNIRFLGQQTSISSVNFNFTKTIGYNFLFTPLKTGTLTIPSIPVNVNGKIHKTKPILIQVLSSRKKNNKMEERSLDNNLDNNLDGEPLVNSNEPDVFVSSEVNPKKAYVGQQLIQKLKIYTSKPLGDNAQVSRKHIDGTIEEQLNDNSQQRTTEVINGKGYQVEQALWAFLPISSGQLKIPSMDVTIPIIQESKRRRSANPFFDDFFGSSKQIVPRSFETDTENITVLDLPLKGKPSNFSGLVGSFSIDHSWSSSEFVAGESSTLVITVEGDGNLRDLKLDDLASDTIKVYSDNPSVELDVKNDVVISKKTFKLAVIPQKMGVLTFPEISISYFDPSYKVYKNIKIPATTLNVKANPKGDPVVKATDENVAKQSVQETGAHDIVPIHTQASDSLKSTYIPIFSYYSFFVFLFPIFCFSSIAGIMEYRKRNQLDPETQKKRLAFRYAISAIKALENDNAIEERARIDKLSRIFKEYIGDKSSVSGAALTAKEARLKLEEHGIPSDLAEDVESLLEKIEQYMYAPKELPTSFKELKKEVRQILERVDKTIKV